MKPSGPIETTRVAWIAPTLARSWRWQPVLREFQKLLPNTAVFTGEWPGYLPGFEGAFDVRLLRGIRFVAMGRRSSGSPRGFTWASPMVLRELWKFRPQVILTNGFHLCTIYAILLKFLLGARVVLLWQGVSPETGGTQGTRLRFRRLLSRFFDLAICNTREGVEYLEELVRMPAEKVWCRTFEVAQREPLSMRTEGNGHLRSLQKPTFLFVGRMIRGKGVQQFLEALGLLAKRAPADFSVLMAGGGAHETELRQRASELGLNGRIRWLGPVNYESLGVVYEAADVVVLPSLEDTWGVVVLEAMTFGKPVLCSRYAGSSEMVRHGINGFVFDPYQPEELADLMERFIREPGLAHKCGAASQTLIAQHTPQSAAKAIASAVTNGAAGKPDSRQGNPDDSGEDSGNDANPLWREVSRTGASAARSQGAQSSEAGPLSLRARLMGRAQSSIGWIYKGFLAVLDQGFISVSNFILAILLARTLAPESYGAYALAFEVFLLLSVVQTALVLEPMSVLGPSLYRDRLHGYWRALFQMHVGSSFGVALTLGALALWLERAHAAEELAGALLGVAMAWPFVSYFWLARRYSYVKLAPGSAVVGGSLYLAILLGGLLVAHGWWRLTPFAAFVLMAIAGLATGVVMRFRGPLAGAGGDGEVDAWDAFRRHWSYGSWALAASVAIWLSYAIFYPLLAYLHGTAETSSLKALLNLNSPVGQAFVAISLLALPHASQVHSHESRAGLARVGQRLGLLYAVGCIAYWGVLIPFREPLVDLLYAGQYSHVTHLVPLAALWSTFRIAATSQAITLRAMLSPASVFVAYAAACVVAVAVGVPLTWKFGLLGTLWSLALSSAVALVAASLLARRGKSREVSLPLDGSPAAS